MHNKILTVNKFALAICLLIIFGAVIESKGEFKVITLGQQPDPISRQTIDLSARSLTVTKNGLVYLSTILGLRAYEISTGNQSHEITLPPKIEKRCVFGITFRNKIELINNEEFLVMSVGCEITRVDTKTFLQREVLFTLGEDGSLTNSFAISPDQELLAVSTNQCFVCIWNLKTHSMIAKYKPGGEKLGDLAFSSDGKKLIVSSFGVWDREKKSFNSFKLPKNASYKIKFLSDNLRYVSAGIDQYVDQQNISTEKINVRYTYGGRADTFAISDDEKLVATGGVDSPKIRLFNAKTGKLIRTLEGHTKLIFDLVFSKDNKKLISSSLDGTIRIWNIN
jgi:hypothetical protein